MNRGGERSVTRLPNDPSAVPTARRFASQAVASYGGNEEVLDKTRLLVTELTTTAVLHAHSAIRLSVEPIDGVMRVEVRDDDPRPLQQPSRPEPDATRGRGLW